CALPIYTLLLTGHLALILEVKNFGGTLYFDPVLNQLIQTNQNGEVKGYPNPIEQAKHQQRALKKWLDKHKLSIPIEFLVVISKPSTIIKTAPGYEHNLQKVLHVQYLLSKIEKIHTSYKIQVTSTRELKRISRLLLKEHIPETFDILKFYKIPLKEIKTGVICPACSMLPMKRHQGTWFCQRCRMRDKNQHTKAVRDFFLLNNDLPITN